LPLLKKLNLRFLATFRIAFGTLSESYQDYLSTNLKLRAPDQSHILNTVLDWKTSA
jgi:hypothetical protein